MNLDEFNNDASQALKEDHYARQFIEKWVPIVTNTVQAMKQRTAFLELELETAQSEREA